MKKVIQTILVSLGLGMAAFFVLGWYIETDNQESFIAPAAVTTPQAFYKDDTKRAPE